MGRTTGAAVLTPLNWITDKPTKPGFYWMNSGGQRNRVVEIKLDKDHGLYILQNSRAVADLPEYDRSWTGPLEEPQ